MKPTHNIVVGSSYTKDGEEKTRWTNIGVLMTGEKNGKRRTVIKLNTIPVGEWDGFASVFPIDRDNSSNNNGDMTATAKRTMGVSDINDEPIDLSAIPF